VCAREAIQYRGWSDRVEMERSTEDVEMEIDRRKES
jgi:hypothetical protein